MNKKLCEVCDYPLDKWGRCASCARVTNEDVAQIKTAKVFWTECKVHGALEANPKERMYRATWTVPNPRDKRKKITHHEWRYKCAACWDGGDLSMSTQAQTFKEVIELPPHAYEAELADRMKRWQEKEVR